MNTELIDKLLFMEKLQLVSEVINITKELETTKKLLNESLRLIDEWYIKYIELQKENELLKDRLTHEVEMIECAANDEIGRIGKELEITKRELYQQRFNNKHNLSIDQKISDEIERLQKQNELLKQCVEFYADKNNWYGKGAPFNEDKTRRMIIASIDTEGSDWVGGFKARECFAKLEKNE